MKRTHQHAGFGPAVGAMANGTHKHFRRIFCNNYPIAFRREMVGAIEGTPEERREQAAEDERIHRAALARLEERKSAALKKGDYNTAKYFQNQIDELTYGFAP